ncbi:hypothetical protein ABPG77_007079 [Micractinium sp. CCAP 211/92]
MAPGQYTTMALWGRPQPQLSESSGSAAVGKTEDAAGKRRNLRDRAAKVTAHPAGQKALAAAAAWLALRTTIEVFHRSRRAFLRQLLFDVSAALQDLGQDHWLDFGCLLGVHRDGDLILTDNDIDLAVLNPDWPSLLEGLRSRLPTKYSLKVVTPQCKPESSWIRVYCPLGMADLFGAYDDGGGQVYVDCGHGDTMHIDRGLVLPCGRKDWRGHVLSVPANLEGTLAKRYGPTWRTPAYLDKGADTVEGSKLHTKLFRLLARIGLRI